MASTGRGLTGVLEVVLALDGEQARVTVPQSLVYPLAASIVDLRNQAYQCTPMLMLAEVRAASASCAS